MALDAQLTKISVHASKKPSGFTDPGGSNLTASSPTYQDLALSVAKSVVALSTVKATTFDKIRTDVAVGIEKQIADKLAAEFDDTANTITYNIDWKDVNLNQSIASGFYTNAAAAYVCIVDVYVNVAAV